MKTKQQRRANRLKKRKQREDRRQHDSQMVGAFARMWRKPIQQVVEACIDTPSDRLCAPIAFAVQELSEGTLKVQTGWLIVHDNFEHPLICTHAWNEDSKGNRVDLSPWSKSTHPVEYVPRSQKAKLLVRFTLPTCSRAFFEAADQVARGEVLRKEIQQIVWHARFVQGGGQLIGGLAL